MPSGEEVIVSSEFDLRTWTTDCIDRLRRFAEANPSHHAAVRYASAISVVGGVEIKSLGDQAFIIEGTTLILNAAPLARVFEVVREDLDRGDNTLDPSQFMILCEMVTAIFLLHEMRHIDQGIGAFEDVQKLKRLGLSSLIAEFDLLADRDALVIFSEIYQDWFETKSEAFSVGLSFSPRYFFKAFSFSVREKPHKALRAISLLLMLARCHVLSKQESVIAPLDSVITFNGLELNALDESRPFVLIAEHPFKKFYGIADDDWQTALYNMIADIEDANFDTAFARACEIIAIKELR